MMEETIWYGVILMNDNMVVRLLGGKRGQALLFNTREEAEKVASQSQEFLAKGFWANIQEVKI